MKILLLCANLKHFADWVKEKRVRGGNCIRKCRNKAIFVEFGVDVEYICFTPNMNTEHLRGCRVDKIQAEIWISEREMMFFNTFVRGDMSNLILNWRFGTRHLKVWLWGVSFKVNPYHVENKPEKWFERYW